MQVKQLVLFSNWHVLQTKSQLKWAFDAILLIWVVIILLFSELSPSVLISTENKESSSSVNICFIGISVNVNNISWSTKALALLFSNMNSVSPKSPNAFVIINSLFSKLYSKLKLLSLISELVLKPLIPTIFIFGTSLNKTLGENFNLKVSLSLINISGTISIVILNLV